MTHLQGDVEIKGLTPLGVAHAEISLLARLLIDEGEDKVATGVEDSLHATIGVGLGRLVRADAEELARVGVLEADEALGGYVAALLDDANPTPP